MQLADECFGGQALLQRPDLQALVSTRIQQAVALRRALGLRCGGAGEGDAAAGATTVFRLVNSEGDRLSGLIVDALGDHLVVSSSGGRAGGWGWGKECMRGWGRSESLVQPCSSCAARLCTTPGCAPPPPAPP